MEAAAGTDSEVTPKDRRLVLLEAQGGAGRGGGGGARAGAGSRDHLSPVRRPPAWCPASVPRAGNAEVHTALRQAQ